VIKTSASFVFYFAVLLFINSYVSIIESKLTFNLQLVFF